MQWKPARLACLFLLAPLLEAQVSAGGLQGAGDTPWHSSYDETSLAELPISSGFWGILQSLEPGAVVDPLDFGGLAAARLPLLSVEAGSWTTTGYGLNGFDAGDPYQPGRPLFVPDPSAIESVMVRYGPRPASSRSAGAEIAVLTRSAGARWHGSVSSYFTGSRFASGNLPRTAARAGLLRSESFHWYTRDNIQFGGPVTQYADVFASATGQWASQRAPREPVHDRLNTRLQLGTARGNLRLGDRDRIDATFTGSRIDRSGFGTPAGLESLTGRRTALTFQAPADLLEEDHLDSVQVGWTRGADKGGQEQILEVRYGYGIGHLDTAAPPAGGQSRLELLDGAVEGPPPLANLGVRTRHQLEGVYRSGALQLGASRHQFSAGGGWQLSNSRNRLTAPSDLHLILANGQPASLVQLNTPLDSRGRVTTLGFHVTDEIVLTRWLSLNAGVRGESVRGSLPPQSSPKGVYAPARQFPVGSTPVVWTDWAPRVALAVSPPWKRAPVLRASYSRYHHPLGVRHLDFANPNSLSGEEYEWLDRNGDRSWQPGETGILLRRFGGAYSTVDASVRRPYLDEFTVGMEATLPFALRASLRMFRRDDKRRLAAVNTGVPFQLPDGGPSYRLRPDLESPVFEQDPATFGRDRFLLANTDLRSFSKGLVAQLSGEGNRYWWRLSFVAEKGYGPANFGNAAWENDPGVVGSLLQGPNTLLNATGRIFFDRAYVAKFQGVWRLPGRFGGLELGAIAAYWDGLPFGRRLLIEGLAQGPLVVLATPRGSPEGGHRTEFNLTLDVRVSRRFELPFGTLRFVADVFNLPNLNNNTREKDLSGAEFNQRLPLAIQPPRFARFGVEYRF